MFDAKQTGVHKHAIVLLMTEQAKQPEGNIDRRAGAARLQAGICRFDFSMFMERFAFDLRFCHGGVNSGMHL